MDPWITFEWNAWPNPESKIDYSRPFEEQTPFFGTPVPGEIHQPANTRASSSGDIGNPVVLGETKKLDEVRFLLVNGPESPLDLRPPKSSSETRLPQMRIRSGPWTLWLDWLEADDSNAYQVTHVGVLRRSSGATFTFSSALSALDLLATALSFMRGGMCGLLLPTGVAGGNVRCVNIGRPSTDSRERRSFSWYHRQIPSIQIQDFLTSAMKLKGANPQDRVTKWAMLYAVRAFETPIEVGLTQAMAGLEYLADSIVRPLWTTTQQVRNMQWTTTELERNWEKVPAHIKLGNLGRLLSLPAVKREVQVVARARSRTKGPLSPADRHSFVIGHAAWARNEHVHPKGGARETYPPGVWVQAYMLAGEWMTVATLRRLGYSGLYMGRLGTRPKHARDLKLLRPLPEGRFILQT